MRVRLAGLVVAGVLLVTQSLAAADRPPQDLHLVDGHWTAWNPPQPAAGSQVHVIERGDTLWDLAARFHGDPYLWPQIWERNQYILDAHWIYPGDPLVLGPEVAPVDTLAEEGGEAEPEDDGTPDGDVLTSDQAAGDPVPLGGESDIYCSGFIGDLDEKFEHTIIGSEYESIGPDLDKLPSYGFRGKYGRPGTAKYNLSTGDIVYLDGGRAEGMSPGALFTVIQPQRQVIHPVTKQVTGRFYHYLGRIRVLSVQEETAIGEIVHSCDPILVGQQLRTFEPEPVPLGRIGALRPVNYPEPEEDLRDNPVILFTQDDLVSIAEDHVVYIDRGEDAEVTPGDMYTIYRKNRDGLPPIVVGELAVLAVHKNSSLARVIESRYAVFIGDWLSPK
ncbi:MAG TPA: LysM peptidoglycan-binding domain-containing protein [Thermoanaerobaculia bacterium]|nr:LysM peptidoglycan-binding domain-containing protein [Thermoanaerobaculia bacterium]